MFFERLKDKGFVKRLDKATKKALKITGEEETLNVVIEELLELTTELQKSRRRKRNIEKFMPKITEEAVDVFISLNHLFNIFPEVSERFEKAFEQKLTRLEDRVKNNPEDL